MAYTARTRLQLIESVIRKLEDFGTQDVLNGTITDSATTFICTDSAFEQYCKGVVIEMNQEKMMVTANPSSTTITVRRGIEGTTAAAHSDGVLIRIKPNFGQMEILELIDTCIESEVQKKNVDDTTTTTDGTVYLYDMPTGITEETLIAAFIRSSATDSTARYDARRITRYKIHPGQGTGGLDQFEFGKLPADSRYIAWEYRSGYTYLETDASSCDLPANAAAQSLPVLYACAHLMPTGDNKRLARDLGGFPSGSTPQTARGRSGDFYMKEFERIRRREGLVPSRSTTRTTP